MIRPTDIRQGAALAFGLLALTLARPAGSQPDAPPDPPPTASDEPSSAEEEESPAPDESATEDEPTAEPPSTANPGTAPPEDEPPLPRPKRKVGGGNIDGIEVAEQEKGDGWRRAANVGLWLPRQIIEGVFLATGAAGSLAENEQVVPRVRDMVSPRSGQIAIFPTLFAETQNTLNVGVRMLARYKNFASSLRAGYGSYNDLVLGTRLRLTLRKPTAMALGTEELFQRRRRTFRGIGKRPQRDSRNQFAGPERKGRYRESRQRWLVTYGIRPNNFIEVLASSSIQRRLIRDPRGNSRFALSTVFVPGSVRGVLEQTEFMYSELALRLDTRATRGGPSTGFLVEGYYGISDGVFDTEGRFGRAGGRTAAFVRLFKSSNILSPKVVLDGLYEIEGEAPFFELPDQPDYRGLETRIDFTTAVASLDYRWAVGRYSAARLFVDAATAAPSVDRLNAKHMKWAGGFGLDMFSTTSPLGSAFVSFSKEGARLVVNIGTAEAFGDRQHR